MKNQKTAFLIDYDTLALLHEERRDVFQSLITLMQENAETATLAVIGIDDAGTITKNLSHLHQQSLMTQQTSELVEVLESVGNFLPSIKLSEQSNKNSEFIREIPTLTYPEGNPTDMMHERNRAYCVYALDILPENIVYICTDSRDANFIYRELDLQTIILNFEDTGKFIPEINDRLNAAYM
jgi:hypothetical protein